VEFREGLKGDCEVKKVQKAWACLKNTLEFTKLVNDLLASPEAKNSGQTGGYGVERLNFKAKEIM
jgi:hypothetical protein